MRKLRVSWEEYIKHIKSMVQVSHRFNADIVVGLTRGGLTPGVSLSHSLQIPMIPFDPHVLHANGQERDTISLPISPIISKKLLIVDDVSDTGCTFTKCIKFFEKRGFKCYTMSIFNNACPTVFIPDYTCASTDHKWVIFPYETTI